MSRPRDLNPQHPSNDEPLDPTEAMGLDPIDDLDDALSEWERIEIGENLGAQGS